MTSPQPFFREAGSGPGIVCLHSNASTSGQWTALVERLAPEFHVFAVEWDSSHMTFFVDSNPFFTVNRATLEQTRGPWVFDHPFFILLNNAVGGDFPGPPGAATVLPQNMTIDYVRVFQ